MKSLFALICCILMLASSSLSQKAVSPESKPSGVYKLGAQTVLIPAPDDFSDTMISHPKISGLITATESPSNETLAVHVANDLLSRMKKDDLPDLPFYTKVSVSRQLRELELNEKDFQTVVAGVKSAAPDILDENGPLFKKNQDGTREGLKKHLGYDTDFTMSEPKMIGYFDDKPNIFSALIIMNVSTGKEKTPLACSMSLVLINKKVVFLYAYRVVSSDHDLTIIRDFTKAWTAKTAAANK
jgi:hypothetical protein